MRTTMEVFDAASSGSDRSDDDDGGNFRMGKKRIKNAKRRKENEIRDSREGGIEVPAFLIFLCLRRCLTALHISFAMYRMTLGWVRLKLTVLSAMRCCCEI
jgi:hypothetical protein